MGLVVDGHGKRGNQQWRESNRDRKPDGHNRKWGGMGRVHRRAMHRSRPGQSAMPGMQMTRPAVRVAKAGMPGHQGHMERWLHARSTLRCICPYLKNIRGKQGYVFMGLRASC